MSASWRLRDAMPQVLMGLSLAACSRDMRSEQRGAPGPKAFSRAVLRGSFSSGAPFHLVLLTHETPNPGKAPKGQGAPRCFGPVDAHGRVLLTVAEAGGATSYLVGLTYSRCSACVHTHIPIFVRACPGRTRAAGPLYPLNLNPPVFRWPFSLGRS